MKSLAILFIGALVVSCNFFPEKGELTYGEIVVKQPGAGVVDFTDVSRKVLIPHCVNCHSEYLSYKTGYRDRSKILSQVLADKMPRKAEPLSKNLKELLKEWVDNGAPGSEPNDGGNANAPGGLSKKMQELYKKHQKIQPVLDDLSPMNLTTGGKAVSFNFGDGKVAELQYGLAPIIKLSGRIDFLEDTCGIVTPRACVLVSHLRFYKLRLAWTQHPDPERINKTVEYAEKDGDGVFSKVENAKYMISNIGAINSRLDEGLKNYLMCDDWDWIKGNELDVLSWGVEDMGENPETDLNENRTNAGMYDFKLTRFDKNIYRMQTPRFMEVLNGRFVISSILGEAGSFYYSQEQNQCMVGFKLDSSSIISSFTSQGGENQTFEFKQYLSGQDGVYGEDKGDFINYLIESAQEGVTR